jgi:hypothetical protein
MIATKLLSPKRAAALVLLSLPSEAMAGSIDIQLNFQEEIPVVVRTRVQGVVDRLESWIQSPAPGDLSLNYEVLWNTKAELASANPGWFWELNGLSVPAACYLGSGHDKPLTIIGRGLADGIINLNQNSPEFSQPGTAVDTILVHEILHTFGFVSSFVEATDGWGMWTSELFPTDQYLTPYDSLLTDENGTAPIVGSSTPAATSPLFLGGDRLLSIREESLPVFTPACFKKGSSVAHLDYYSIMAKSLTPFTGLHAYETAILEDLGWRINHPSSVRIHETQPIYKAGPAGPIEIPNSWHEGDRWGGLPPSADTDVTLEGGTQDYFIEILDGLAQADDLTIAGSALSMPTLKIRRPLQCGGSLSLAMPPDSRGSVDLDSAPLFVGGLLLVGPGGDLSARSAYLRAQSVFQSGGVLRIAGGSRMETTLLDVSGGELLLLEDSSLGASAPDGLTTRVSGGRLEVHGESLVGSLFEITGGTVDLEGSISLGRTFNLGGGEVRIYGTENSFNAGNLTEIESRWGGTNLTGASSGAALMINHRNLHLGGSDRVVSNLALQINGPFQMNGSTLTLTNSSLELNGSSTLAAGSFAISPSSSFELNGPLHISGGFGIQYGGESPLVFNGGISKSGAESSTISGPIEINGNLEISQGVMTLSGAGIHNGRANIEAGATLEVHPGLRSSAVSGGGTLKVLGSYNNESSLVISPGLTMKATGFAQSSGGILSGSGTLHADAELSGTVSPGMSPGTLTILGNVTFLPDCVLSIELGEDASTSDLLRIADPLPADGLPSGGLVLDGILDLASSSSVPEGTYTIITYEGPLDDRGLEIQNSPVGFTAVVEQIPGKVVLRLTASGYLSWAAGYGLTGVEALPDAEPHGDGVANILKYAFGMDPRQINVTRLTPGSGTIGLPYFSVETDATTNQRHFRLEFVRRKNGGISYTPMSSSALERNTFQPFPENEVVTSINSTWERVVVEETLESEHLRRFGLIDVTMP